VNKSVDKNKGANSPAGTTAWWGARHPVFTYDDQQTEHNVLAIEVQGAATKVRHEEPRSSRTTEAHSRITNANRSGILSGKASLFQEIRSPTHHGRATGLLDKPNKARNLSSAQINTPKAVPLVC
jgi:hypothetical protein